MTYSSNDLTIYFSNDNAILYFRFKHIKTREDPDEFIEHVCVVARNVMLKIHSQKTLPRPSQNT